MTEMIEQCEDEATEFTDELSDHALDRTATLICVAAASGHIPRKIPEHGRAFAKPPLRRLTTILPTPGGHGAPGAA